MEKSEYNYVTYIRTTPEKLWQALTDPEFTRRYWMESWQESEWTPGSAWRLTIPGGTSLATGAIVEIEPPRKLIVTWRNEKSLELQAEGYSRCTYELKKQGDSVKLTVHHVIDRAASKGIESVSGGWPLVLASLKSLLETGESLVETRQWGPCEPVAA